MVFTPYCTFHHNKQQGRLALAEQALEDALEAVLDAECGYETSQGDTFDDYPSVADHNDSDSDDSNNSSDDNEEHVVIGKHSSNSSSSRKASKDSSSSSATDAKAADTIEPIVPDNFSRVDPDQSIESIQQQYPLFATATMCTVEVCAGQMLYLPCGWFHEVTSYSDSSSSTSNSSIHSSTNSANTDTSGHMALNYWFHPPDAPNSFEQPYSSTFWQQDWNSRLASGEGIHFTNCGRETNTHT
jgi:Cupin-like domain